MPDTAPPSKYGFVKIIVNDIDRAVDFYGQAFGFQVARTIEQPTLTEKMLTTADAPGGPFIILYRHKDGRELTVGNGWGPIGFFVADTDKAYSHALAAGATSSREPYETEGVRIAFVLDPEGHEIELVCMPGA